VRSCVLEEICPSFAGREDSFRNHVTANLPLFWSSHECRQRALCEHLCVGGEYLIKTLSSLTKFYNERVAAQGTSVFEASQGPKGPGRGTAATRWRHTQSPLGGATSRLHKPQYDLRSVLEMPHLHQTFCIHGDDEHTSKALYDPELNKNRIT